MIRALIFDFDGLILDTETALIEAYGDVYAARGMAFDRAEFVRCVGHADYAFDPWRPFGPLADRAALEAERKRFNRVRALAKPILPGIVALLDEGRARGLKIGMASNSEHPHVEGHLSALGLLDRFACIACREDVPSPKPEPDVYRLVLNRLGLKGTEAVAFEDSHTGSLAAKRAGLHVVAVPNVSTRHHDFGHVDLQIDALADWTLDAILKGLPGVEGGRP